MSRIVLWGEIEMLGGHLSHLSTRRHRGLRWRWFVRNHRTIAYGSSGTLVGAHRTAGEWRSLGGWLTRLGWIQPLLRSNIAWLSEVLEVLRIHHLGLSVWIWLGGARWWWSGACGSARLPISYDLRRLMEEWGAGYGWLENW